MQIFFILKKNCIKNPGLKNLQMYHRQNLLHRNGNPMGEL